MRPLGEQLISCRCGFSVGSLPTFCPHCGVRLRDRLCDRLLSEGRIRLVHRIGGGGFAVVYLAEHDLHGRIAVKVLKNDHVEDPVVLERWRIEVEANQRFAHPNKPEVYGSGEEVVTIGRSPRTVHWLAMEYLSGYSLHSYLVHHEEHGKHLKLDQVVDLMEQVLGVIGAAHECGVVHRDLHPNNINITVGSAGMVRAQLFDFGIAMLLDRPVESDQLRFGTRGWMSPQQLSGEPVDHRTDLYNLGLLLYRMLTGVHPYAGAKTGEYLAAEMSPPPPPPSAAIGPGSPVMRKFDRITRKALEINPKRRQRDARTMLRQVRSTLKPARRRSKVVWLLLLLLAVTVTALFVRFPELWERLPMGGGG